MSLGQLWQICRFCFRDVGQFPNDARQFSKTHMLVVECGHYIVTHALGWSVQDFRVLNLEWGVGF